MLTRLRKFAGVAIRQARARARRAVDARRVASQAAAAIRQLRLLQSANLQATFCGVFLVEHIGDIIACEPVIERIRGEIPNAFIVWVVRRAYVELLTTHPGIGAVVAVDSLAVVAPIIRSGVFDASFDLHVNKKPTGVGELVHEKAWGNPAVDCENYFRYGTILRAFSTAAGIPIVSGTPKLYLPNTVADALDAFGLPTRFIAIHTTSNEEAKNWSPAAWLELVTHIVIHCGVPVIEVGLESTVALEHERFRSLCGRLSIVETAEVVRRASFFIGIDSGPAHMANAWRIPSLLLFGSYRGEERWMPYDGFFGEDPDRWVLRHSGALSGLDAGTVIHRLEAIEQWGAMVSREQ